MLHLRRAASAASAGWVTQRLTCQWPAAAPISLPTVAHPSHRSPREKRPGLYGLGLYLMECVRALHSVAKPKYAFHSGQETGRMASWLLWNRGRVIPAPLDCAIANGCSLPAAGIHGMGDMEQSAGQSARLPHQQHRHNPLSLSRSGHTLVCH